MAQLVPVDTFDLVIFGGTGDLAMRKLLPALYHRDRDGQVTADSRIIAASRGEVTRGDYGCPGMSRAHVSAQDERRGQALACKLIPKSALSLRVLGPVQRNILRSKNRAVTDYWRSLAQGASPAKQTY